MNIFCEFFGFFVFISIFLRPKSPVIYNCTSGGLNPFSWRELGEYFFFFKNSENSTRLFERRLSLRTCLAIEISRADILCVDMGLSYGILHKMWLTSPYNEITTTVCASCVEYLARLAWLTVAQLFILLFYL